MTERSHRSPHRPSHRHEDHDELPRGRPPPGLKLDPAPLPTPTHPPEIPLDRLDQDALRVVTRLKAMGHQAYFVGGCVRDLLLDAKPKDFDIATDAHPGEVRAIFRNCRLIGRRFRLAHVYFRDGKVIEVATFRKNPTELAAEEAAEGGEGDSPDLLITRDNVFGTAQEDAVRRDFTVNGLFYDVFTGEVIDYVGGRADLESHRMATIGDPEVRMREDPVRALRAVRFAARLGFAIAPDTFEAMRRHASELARCAPARVLEEIFKLLRCGGSARAFALLRACGALPLILPALGTAHDRWDEAQRKRFIAHLGALDRLVRSGAQISEAVLLGSLVMHLGSAEDGSRPEAEALLEELVRTSRLPRKVAEAIRLALQSQRSFREPPKRGRRRRRGRGPAGQPYFTDALQLLTIAVEATGEGLEVLNRWRAEAAQAPQGHHHDDEGADGDLEPERPTERHVERHPERQADHHGERPSGGRGRGQAATAAAAAAARAAAGLSTGPFAGPATVAAGVGATVEAAVEPAAQPRPAHPPRREPQHEPRREPRTETTRTITVRGTRHPVDDALPAGGLGAVMEVGAGLDDTDRDDEADDEGDDDLEGAEEVAGVEAGSAGRPSDAGAPDQAKRPRRRRRGGRRRRRRGAGTPGAATPPTAPPAG
jgi:poly(A) polymerase